MRLCQTIRTHKSPSASRDLITAYLERTGYKFVGADPYLTYRRGSTLGPSFASTPKGWSARARVEIKPGPDSSTEVFVDLDVDTTGQSVGKEERRFWDEELAGLVEAVNGEKIPATTATATGDGPAGKGLGQLAAAEEASKLRSRLRVGADWFTWIGALSLLNSILFLVDGRLRSPVGLAVAQLVDGLFLGAARELAPGRAIVSRVIALAIDAAIVGLLVAFGVLGRRRKTWAFAAGMGLYAVDGLVFLWLKDWPSLAFHAYALFGLYRGLEASRQLGRGEATAAAV